MDGKFLEGNWCKNSSTSFCNRIQLNLPKIANFSQSNIDFFSFSEAFLVEVSNYFKPPLFLSREVVYWREGSKIFFVLIILQIAKRFKFFPRKCS